MSDETYAADQETVDQRLAEYWQWIAVALFLLLALDLLTSLYALEVVGIQYESNPLMTWLFTRSIGVVIGVHIAVGVLAALFFYGIIESIRNTTPQLQWIMMRALEVFIGVLVAAGLFIVANNLAVLFGGASLL